MRAHLRLYTRKNCSLCDNVRAVILRVGERMPIALEEIDIDRDPELRAEFDTEVPVVELDDREVSRYRLTEAQLLNALERAGFGVKDISQDRRAAGGRHDDR